MHILLTNDDGIYAEGIYALYLELKKSREGHGRGAGHGAQFRRPRDHPGAPDLANESQPPQQIFRIRHQRHAGRLRKIRHRRHFKT